MFVIRDAFFKDPYLMRKKALEQEYTDTSDTYPGYRCDAPKDMGDKVASEVRYLIKDPTLKVNSCQLQYTPGEFKEGLVHQDEDNLFLSIVFLSPNPPPNSGTLVYDSSYSPFTLNECIKSKELQCNFHRDRKNIANNFYYDKMRNKLNSRLKVAVTADNVFNRFLLFPSAVFHRAEEYFGTSLWDSRLVLITFFY